MAKKKSPWKLTENKERDKPGAPILQPEAFSDFSPGGWEYYKAMCKETVYFFNRVAYPEGAVQLPNGIITRDLRKYVNVQIDHMRFMFIKGHGENFIYTYDLLTKIMALPIWK